MTNAPVATTRRRAARRTRRWATVARRIPATLVLAALLGITGLVSGGFTSGISSADWYERVAYGIPALQAGAWWTPITGTFLVMQPAGYLVLLLLVPAGMGWLEHLRGSRVAIAWFLGGQAFALAATMLFLVVARASGSGWATELAQEYDVGPSGGLFACLAAAVCALPLPWRTRGQFVLAAFCISSVMFLGTIADVEHAAAVGLVLAVNIRTLTRPTTRERRFVAWVALVALGTTQLILAVIPTTGPFGATQPGGISVADVASDALIIVMIANGVRKGFRAAWIIAVVLGVFNVLVGVLAVVALTFLPRQIAESRDDVSLAAATAFLWLLTLVYLLFTGNAFRARLRRRIQDGRSRRAGEARELVQSTGGGALSWMATWPDNLHFFGADRTTVVAYQVHAGVAIALADPIAPPAAQRTALGDWADACERAGFVPSVFGASEACRAQMPATWRSLQIAEDTIVELPGLGFTGKRWNTVRTALNRAARESVTFRLTTLASEPKSVRRQLDAISEQWVGDKGLPEMRFTLGSIDEALDPAVRLALAATADGRVDGFLSWLPIYGDAGRVRGWTLDLMRRRDGGFPPVMEFLIASSAAAFRDEGAELLSLSGAPLAHSQPQSEGIIERVLDQIGAALEPVYGFRSLHTFKQKFNPRAEPLYVLFPDEGDLPAVALAITRAYLPDASIVDLVKAGLELSGSRPADSGSHSPGGGSRPEVSASRPTESRPEPHPARRR
jgi:phosphatidylglycerol lysyltransferase